MLAPISGDPGEVRRVAAGLGAEADLLASLARTVRGLADPSITVWASPSGQAFAQRAGAVPQVVERVSRRYGVAAAALRTLAEALQEAQAQVAWAQRVHEQSWGPFLAAGEQMGIAEGSADPAQRALAGRHRAEMVAHGERVQLAVRRHADARDAFGVADRACAAVLRGLLDDGLADSRAYDVLTGTGRVAGEVSEAAGYASLVPALRPLGVVSGVAGGVGVTADAVVLAAYGDGDVVSLALAAGSAATGGLGSVLKAGGRATNAPAVAAATSRSARRELRLTARDRIATGVLGSRATAAKQVRVVALPAKTPAPRWTPPPRSATALRPWVREQTEVRAVQWARARWVDDLAVVLGAKGASARWYGAGLVADGTAAGLDRTGRVRGRQLDAREEADLRQSGDRHR